MKSKHWLSIFFALFFVGIAGFMALNYHIDPTDYFSVTKNSEYYSPNNYARAIKSQYVKKHADEIEAVVVGGSKAGVLSPDLLTEYTGKKYYNYYFNSGNFSDYQKYITFLVENTGISEITLHISSFEVSDFTKEDSGGIFKLPAILSGSKWKELTELCSYLMTDINTTIHAMSDSSSDPRLDSLKTGERNWVQAEALFAQDPDTYIIKHVINTYDKCLTKFFNQKAASAPAFDDNIDALRQIKALCDKNGITLKVVIGASFVGERDTYESYRYYEYLREIVSITDVWDFSNFNEVNMNPYNFINRKHYDKAVGTLMLDTMYGKRTHEGFGIYLTKDNIDDYLDQRVADYRRLEEEFRSTGTLALPGLDDKSFISKA